MTFTFEQEMEIIRLRDRVVADMEVSINEHENVSYRRDGCLAGLEIIKNLVTPTDFQLTLEARRTEEQRLRQQQVSKSIFWFYCCATAQIQFVYEILAVGWFQSGVLSTKDKPYLSGNAVLKYAELMGVRDNKAGG